jgi:hypothetical protein
MRKISGSRRMKATRSYHRKLHSNEVRNLYPSSNINVVVKSRRMKQGKIDEVFGTYRKIH